MIFDPIVAAATFAMVVLLVFLSWLGVAIVAVPSLLAYLARLSRHGLSGEPTTTNQDHK